MSIQPIFKALADPTRRDIMHLLANCEMTVGDITAQFDMSRPAIAKHLGILRNAGLVEVRKHGRKTYNTLNAHSLAPLAEWLSFYDPFWDDKLAQLKHKVEHEHD